MPLEADNPNRDIGSPPEAESEVGYTAPELCAQPPNEHFSDRLHLRVKGIISDFNILRNAVKKANPEDVARNVSEL